MSMFYELMMKKKQENIMYATIKGSLTENDGVFSGFSQSNYLITQDVFPLQSTNFEIVTRIKNTATDSNERYFVSSRYRTAFIIGTTRVSANTFTFRLYGGNSTGTGAGWNKASEQITIDETQFFDVKFTYNGTEYALYVNGTKIISYTSSTALYGNDYMYYGKWDTGSNTNVFVGSIDLNNSYIKLGSTKYKLQAVVGYTVVGSPTITDGVVSGFSRGNYLSLPQNLESDNLEMVIDFTTGNSITQYETIFLNRSIFDLEVNISGRLTSYNWETSSYYIVILETDYLVNTNYKVKIKRSGNTISFAYSKNGGAFIDRGSFTITKTATNLPCFGNSSVNLSRYFNGSINMNNTYIKTNNKLWFNGQQA